MADASEQSLPRLRIIATISTLMWVSAR
jgi:hypothetical protein